MWIEMKELRDLDCKNKKIIVRVDLNVPVLEGTITDHSRIHAILPTLEKLINNKKWNKKTPERCQINPTGLST